MNQNGQIQKLTASIRDRLSEVYGDRLHGIILYGSRAIKNEDADSDLDLLVLLSGPVDLGKEIPAVIDAIYPLQLKVDFPIHILPVDESRFKAQEFELYRAARREGVLV
jgi:predicted nucleotidyltransferase